MDNIFQDFSRMFIYIDDILIFANVGETHSSGLDQVLQKVNEYDLKNSLLKCLFGAQKFEFLDCSVCVDGNKPSASKLAELNEFSLPNESMTLHQFLGRANFL